MSPRRQRKAKATSEPTGCLVRFVPGGYYHLDSGRLFTGVRRKPAAPKTEMALLPLALRAAEKPNEWVV